jgi:signal transduction histidine kinase
VGFTAYAMVKHRLMDMRLVVLRGAAYTVLVSAFGVFLALTAVLARTRLAAQLNVDPDALFFITGLAAVLAFQPAKRALESVTDRVFHRRTYDPDRLLSHLGTAMASTLDPRDLASLLANDLAEEMKLESAAVAYRCGDALGVAQAGAEISDADAARLMGASGEGAILFADNLEADSESAAVLHDLGVRVLAPLAIDAETLGAVILGAKRSGEMYSAQDLRFLEILTPEAAIAMKNAGLYRDLQTLASDLTLAEERERRRLAVQLHDGIGQALAICKMRLGQLGRTASPDDAAQFAQVRELLDDAICDARTLTVELSPPLLHELGLEAALEWLGERARDEMGLRCEYLNDAQPKPLTEGVRVLLYQAVRELLANVVKHAQADSVCISSSRSDSEIKVGVEDDGVGFQTDKLSAAHGMQGFGLFSIRERLTGVGGRMEVRSGPGRGTGIFLFAPLQEAPNDQGR